MADAQIAIIDGDPTQIAVIDGDQTQIVMAPGENPAIVTAIPGPQGPAGAVAAAIDGSAALPSIAFASDTDTGLYRVGANQLGVSTGGTQRLVIDASGQIEATSLGSAASPTWTFVGDPNTGVYSPGADQLALSTNGNGRLFIDASGRILAGTSTARANYYNSTGSAQIQVEGTAFSDSSISITSNSNAGSYVINRSNGTSVGSNTLVANNNTVGGIVWQGNDGAEFVQCAGITAAIDGTPGIDNMPGRLVFSTTASGAASPTERLRITSAGLVGIGNSVPGSFNAVGNRLVIGSGSGNQGATIFSGSTSTSSLIFAGSVGGTQGQIFYRHNDNSFGFITNTNVSALNIDSSGRLGIGTASPDSKISIGGTGANRISFSGSTGQQYVGFDASEDVLQVASNTAIKFQTSPSYTERARIDSSGRLLVGTSSARANFFNAGVTSPVQVESTTDAIYSATRNSNNAFGPGIILAKSRGTSVGSNTVVQSGDLTGGIYFQGSDGTEFVETASITSAVDGTPGADDMPGRLVFSTTADGASSPTERMRIKANGATCIGTTTEGTMSGDTVVAIGPNIGIISKSASGIATSGTVDIAINTSGGGYQGFLVVANTITAGATVRTHSTFSVFGRGTDSSIQQIATDNGSGGGASFTVTTPTNGVIRVTNTSGSTTTVSIQFFGGTSF